MLKKIWLSSMSIVAVTMLAEGSFIMTKGEPLKKVTTVLKQSQTNNESTSSGTSASTSNSTSKSTSNVVSNLGKLIYSIDFNKYSTGMYTNTMCKEDFFAYKGENLHYRNHDGSWMLDCKRGPGNSTSIISDGNEKVLRVKYEANSIHATGSSGFIAEAALPKNDRPKEDINNPQTVTLTYYVKFEKGFDWVISGKLPGLAGGNLPSGGVHSKHGFSARYSWYVLDKKNSLVSYLYVHDVPGKYGLEPTLSVSNPNTDIMNRNKNNIFEFQDNKWYKLQQSLKSNTPYKANGTEKIWIDGILVGDFKNIKFIADGMHGKYAIDRFVFSTFHGGGDMRWAPSKEEYSRFKDIKIYVK